MNKQDKRAYLIDINSGVMSKYCCTECGHWAAVVTDVTYEEDFGENKQLFYEMWNYYCLDCKEKFSDWADND